MKNLFLLFVMFLSFVGVYSQDDVFFKAMPLNRMYVAQSDYDTLLITLDRDYNYCYVFVNGSDIDEDKDGDYTDFKFKVNESVLLDTSYLSDHDFGKDGTLSSAIFDVSDFVHKGKNTFILGSTELDDQSDYVVIKDLTLVCGEDNVLYTMAIENILLNNDLEESAKYDIDLKGGEEKSISDYFKKDRKYYIIAFSPNVGADVDLFVTTKDGQSLLDDQTKDYKPAMIQFTPSKSGEYIIKVLLKETKQEHGKTRVKLWFYF